VTVAMSGGGMKRYTGAPDEGQSGRWTIRAGGKINGRRGGGGLPKALTEKIAGFDPRLGVIAIMSRTPKVKIFTIWRQRDRRSEEVKVWLA